jgi:dTDP-4-amino-4,6-dideoxygalactose transaminase
MIEKIFVSQPNLPPLEEFVPYLQEIWNNKTLTNGGPFHTQLERDLCDYLGVKELALFNNGTIALICALHALEIKGEVITTPYSFVATAHSLMWNNIKPVFVDIEPDSFNMDPKKIEAAITEHTSAILPVHCYGYPCDVDAIKKIADMHHLKVIYDAAHAFGVHTNDDSLLNYGDLSVLSFHATKVFSTFEGGAIVCSDSAMKNKINNLKNFGIIDEVTVTNIGINGKLNEVSAAFGLLQLSHMEETLHKRKRCDEYYRKYLANISGIRLIEGKNTKIFNYSYFPILIENSFPLSREALFEYLKENEVYTRRYFYPLISAFTPYQSLPSSNIDNLKYAAQAAQQVLCLPLYSDLEMADQRRIIKLIKEIV